MIITEAAVQRLEEVERQMQADLEQARARGVGVPGDAELRDFFRAHRRSLLIRLTESLARREAPALLERPDEWTLAKRSEANLAAMRLLVSKPLGAMTPSDRQVLARYSGHGGLSLERIASLIPPSLEVETRGLMHEYYTPTVVTRDVARIVQPLLPGLVGLDGVIRGLEPSAGIGRFILAFDEASTVPIRWTAVEYSRLAAMLLQGVRPGLTVFTGPFERWVAQHGDQEQGRINLVAANPPFGDRGAAAFEDKDRSYREDKYDAYFLLRCLDLLAPNGLGIFIVPMGVLSDPRRRKLRARILLSNHLITAYRLPSTVVHDGIKRPLFPGAHNVTDLIFFRRRSGVLAEPDAKDAAVIEGRYFDEVPRHILGEVDNSYRYAVIGPPINLPPIVERPICDDCRVRTPTARVVNEAPPAEDDPRLPVARSLASRVDRFLAALSRGEDVTLLWPELIEALNAWLRSYGNPYDTENLTVLSRQPEMMRSFLRAFEPTGAIIAALQRRPAPPKVALPTDPLRLAEHLYRQERGLTLARLSAELPTFPPPKLQDMLLDAGWCLDGPGLSQLVPASDYYTGNLWPKYDLVAGEPGDDQATLQAQRLLEVIRPALYSDIASAGFSVREGWVPLESVAAWLNKTINVGYPELELIRWRGLIQVRGVDYEDLDENPKLSPLAINFLGWVNHDMGGFNPEKDKKRFQSKNDAREEIADTWNLDFRNWVDRDLDQQQRLVEAYNRAFRGFVLPKYDDGPLQLARWTLDPKKQLHSYQRAGIRRLLDNRGGILNYDVGVGKTFTAAGFIAAARQQGWAQRPVVLVPNPIILQWRDELARVLPDYRIVLIGANTYTVEENGVLVERSETDKPAQRAAKWARFQAGEYDLALLTYSSLSRTRMNLEAAVQAVEETPALMRQLSLKRRNIVEKKPSERTEREQAILAEGIPAWIMDRLELPENWEYDGEVVWDDLGIDLLVIDEMHNFKNLFLPEPRERGVPAYMGGAGEGSHRAWQLAFRSAAVRRFTGGAGIVGLSATPAKNSPTELYTAVAYINPKAWTDMQIYDAEEFIDRFCVIETRPVVTTKMVIEAKSAMVGFRNVDDLRGVLSRLLEMQSANALAAQGIISKPKAIEYPPVKVDLDAEQRRKTSQYAHDYREKIATGGGGNAALGLIVRLGFVAVHAQADEGYDFDNALNGDSTLPPPRSYRSPKFVAVAERVAANPNCGHIIFLELLAPQVWLREVLAEYGIPRERVALLNAESAPTPADRSQIARDFNEGKYTVVISNSVGGEGANLQRRTCAVHSVDLPWDPMTRRQRIGRGDRQGNELPNIAIYDYLAKHSGDGPRYAKIQGKDAWIEQVMRAEDDTVTNPSAAVDVSPHELIADLTENPEETRELLRQVAEAEENRRRARLLRQVARLLRAADARFRAAEDAENPLEAKRLRDDGQAELESLRRVDAKIWPFFDLARRIADHPSLITDAGLPIYSGLRVAAEVDGRTREYVEFGRVASDRVGYRRINRGTWGTVKLEKITVDPASLAVTWPSEPELFDDIGIAINSLSRRITWDDLGWMWASDSFLATVWSRFAEAIADRLKAVNNKPLLLPAITPQGTLLLTPQNTLTGLTLFEPSQAGFAEFVRLAQQTKFKVADLNEAASNWWERQIPRGLKRQAPVKTDKRENVKTESAPTPEAPTPAVPTPTPATAPPPPVRNPTTPAGRFFQVGQEIYGDTAFVNSLPGVQHVGYGFFESKIPEGALNIDRYSDEQLFTDQVGRLHRITFTGKGSLRDVLDRLEAEGRITSAGVWATWPAQPAPKTDSTEKPAPEPASEADDGSEAELGAMPEPEPEPEAEDAEPEAEDAEPEAEDAEEAEAEETPAPGMVEPFQDGLEFAVDVKELASALSTIKRATVHGGKEQTEGQGPKPKSFENVSIECSGHVFLRVGNSNQFFELRLQKIRCMRSGQVGVNARGLADAIKHLKGMVTLQKKPGESNLTVISGPRKLSLPATAFFPVRLDERLNSIGRVPVKALLDLLARTTSRISTEKARVGLNQLVFKGGPRLLTAMASDGATLSLASVESPVGAALDGAAMSREHALRLERLLQETMKGSRKAKTPPMVEIRVDRSPRPRIFAVIADEFTFVAEHKTGDIFPDHRKIVEDLEPDTLAVVPRAELLTTMQTITTSSGSAVPQATFSIGGDVPLTVTSDEFNQQFEVFVDGPAKRFGINAAWAAEVLDGFASPSILVALGEPLGPIVFVAWEGPAPTHRRDARSVLARAFETLNYSLVMPMRL